MWFSVFRQSCTELFVMHRSTETNLPPLTPIKTISISYTAWAVYHPVNLTHTFVWIAVTTKWLIERDYKFFTFPLYLLTKELREKNMSFLGGYPPFGPSKGVPQKNWHSWLFMTTIFRQHAASIYGFVHQFVSSKKDLCVGFCESESLGHEAAVNIRLYPPKSWIFRIFHDKVKKYDCYICDYQVSHKNSLVRHKKI